MTERMCTCVSVCVREGVYEGVFVCVCVVREREREREERWYHKLKLIYFILLAIFSSPNLFKPVDLNNVFIVAGGCTI